MTNCALNCKVCLAQGIQCKCEHNPWLLYNEKVRDFIRWKELGTKLVIFTFCIGAFGWVGIFIAIAFDYLMLADGGTMIIGDYEEREPKIKHTERKECLAGKHTFCTIQH